MASSRRFALVLVCTFLVPAASAQWTDARNDHEVGYTAGNQADESTYVWTRGDQTGWYPIADILTATISEESEETIGFVVQVASKQHAGGEPHPVDVVRYTFRFGFHGDDRGVVINYYPKQSRAVGWLVTFENGRYRTDEPGMVSEVEGNGWRVDFEKERFRDSKLVPIRAGDILEKVVVRSQTYLFSYYNPCSARTPPVECFKARDVVGTNAVLGDYLVTRSPAGVGHLALTSANPYRSSNGLATTYMFELDLHNLGDQPDAALVRVDQIPADWKMSWPSYVELKPKSITKFPVAVTVPFTHLHGKETYVNVSASSERSPTTTSKLAIGVLWTKIPQPAGHHAELYAHSDGDDEWMNTLKEDPDAKPDATISPSMYVYDVSTKEYGYYVDLNPGLQTGLDFDVGRTLSYTIAAKFREASRPSMALELYVEREDETRSLIARGSTPAQSAAAGDTLVFEGQLPILASGDRIPFVEESNLVLEIRIEYGYQRGPTDVGPLRQEDPFPLLLPEGSTASLPLVEYVDEVDEALLSSLTRYTLASMTETFKQVNPRKLAVFAIDVTNGGRASDEIGWQLIGSNTGWAEVFPQRMSLSAGDNATVLVTVRPPEEAVEGEHAEILLLGQSTEDANAQVFVRLVAQVVTSAEIPDETPLANKLRGIAGRNEAGSPAPGALLLLIALAVGLLAARRGRGMSGSGHA